MESFQSRNTDEDWRLIAKEAPYWGVISADDYRGLVLNDDAKKSFYASGETMIRDLWGFVKRHVKGDFAPKRSLDFGCGVGRLLLPIARLSEEAVGIDISETMLELSATNAVEYGISNIDLILSDDTLSRVTGKFDFVNSYITFQHIPLARGYSLLKALCEHLHIGGVLSVQLTYGKSRRFLSHELPKAKYYRRDGDMIRDLVIEEQDAPTGTIIMFDYDLNYVLALLSDYLGTPVLLLPTSHDGHLGMHILGMRAR